ncbi:MAG: hypothetical protein K6A68_01700 [Clostridiales bacterium]|nr:hypothetical protein [Clostridiales bacterium]
MAEPDRHLTVLVDVEPFAPDSRFRLSGTMRIGLFPSLFLLQCWNLADEDVFRLQNTKELSVMREDSCLAFGQVSDVFVQTVPEGTVTTVAFSLGLDLWESQVSLSVPSGVSVSETVRRILVASGTGIQLLSFPGEDSVFSRGQAFCGRVPDCITSVLSTVSARAYLVPAGLCVIPAESLEATLNLKDKDLTDRPVFADFGGKMILSTTVTGFQPGEEMTLETDGKTYAGLILERMVEADTAIGPWNTQLLVEVHR